MEKLQLLFDGNEKQVFATDEKDRVIFRYKDIATAYGGIKRATLRRKGILTCGISSIIFRYLNEHGVQTHFVETFSEREQVCRPIGIIPINVAVRNYAAGTMARRLALPVGEKLSCPVVEMYYNNDSLRDPMINEDHAVALGLVTREEASFIRKEALKVNSLLLDLFEKLGIKVVDIKLEFGRASDGSIIISDEISPDTCRFWDNKTGEVLDKDRFRHDMGGIIDAYEFVYTLLNRM
ncbi:MAG: phosphoribosylaminoimidazolesuccinocarboxamide synthase [Bacteroidales bacterium]|nr:phosphoribosylaminoimidazolesuccinocarboxamide synthase [Bacteroidales bacterium]